MSAEKISFHSGPMHGQIRELPEGHGDAFPIKQAMIINGRPGIRDGVYTRVHNNSGRSTHDFEWGGYTSPFVAHPTES